MIESIEINPSAITSDPSNLYIVYLTGFLLSLLSMITTDPMLFIKHNLGYFKNILILFCGFEILVRYI